MGQGMRSKGKRRRNRGEANGLGIGFLELGLGALNKEKGWTFSLKVPPSIGRGGE